MARYIDADKLIEELQPAKNARWNKNDRTKSLSEMIEDFCTELKNAPAADVVPKSEADEWYRLYMSIKEDLKQEKLYHAATDELCDRAMLEARTAPFVVLELFSREIANEMEEVVVCTSLVPDPDNEYRRGVRSGLTKALAVVARLGEEYRRRYND